MSALALALATTVLAPAEAATAPGDATTTPGEVGRSGLYGWGLGLEVPFVGALASACGRRHTGWGYVLGGAVSYEVTPSILVRLYFGGGQTTGGEAPIRYIGSLQTSSTPTTRRTLDAEWTMLEAALGGAYVFRSADRSFAPFVGADVGVRYGGFDFRFDEGTKSLQTFDQAGIAKGCTDPTCPSYVNGATGFGWEADLRGGVRLDLATWLSAEPELRLVYTRTSGDPVTNTVQNRDVRSVVADLWLMLATFSVRVGL